MVALARCSAALALPAFLVCFNVHAAEEPAVTGEGPALPYLRAVHAKLHPAWALNFLPMAAAQLPPDDPVNHPSREATLEVTLSQAGALLDARVLKGSQVSGFDNSALDVVKNQTTFTPAPEELLSDDGNVHLYWTFARDHRQCSGLKVARKEAPLPQAMILLMKRGRPDSALARVKAADPEDREAALTAFAKAWLAHREGDKDIGPDATIALARGGDAGTADRLGRMLASHPEAAQGLAALGTPVCPFLKDRLSNREPASRSALLRALRLGATGECLDFLLAAAKDAQLPVSERALAIEGLGNSDAQAARTALRGLAKENTPSLVAAVLLAEARPDAGKGAIFRLTPKLRDPSVVVRGAAAAALARAGGEEGLPQLFLLLKEKEPAPYALVASELARLSGQNSADILGKFLRKSDARIRLIGARALVSRRDEHASRLLAEAELEGNAELVAIGSLVKANAGEGAALPLSEETRPTFLALLAGNGRSIATQALLEGFEGLSPRLRAAFLGDWLASQPRENKSQ